MGNLNLTVLFVFVLTSSLMYGQTSSTQYSNNSNSSMKIIHKESAKYIEALEEEGFEVLRVEEDLIVNEEKFSVRKLYKGVKYVIVVFGDKKIKDIDLTVSKYVTAAEKFVKVGSDQKEDRYAMLTISPEKTAMYKFSFKVYSFYKPYTIAHYGFMVVRKD